MTLGIFCYSLHIVCLFNLSLMPLINSNLFLLLKTFLILRFELVLWKLGLGTRFGCIYCCWYLRWYLFQTGDLLRNLIIIIEGRGLAIGGVRIGWLVALEACQWYRSFFAITVRFGGANILFVEILVQARHLMLRLKMHGVTRFYLRIFKLTLTGLYETVFSAAPRTLCYNNRYQTLAS